jgi:hypothetical protein
MPFKPLFPVRERILNMGPAGAGKTSNFLHIARMCAVTGTGARFFLGDSDFTMDRMLPSYPEIHPYVELHPLYEWPDYVAFGKHVSAVATPDDWVCVDFISSAWKAVQDYYVGEVFKRDIGDYFLAARKKEVAGLEGWVDWNVINALYQQWLMPLLFRTRGHLFCTAKSEPLSDSRRPTEDKATRAMFLPFSIKPVGQKDLPFQFHTLLISDRDLQGNRLLTTVKDRERQEVRALPVIDFAVNYLTHVGRWSVQ